MRPGEELLDGPPIHGNTRLEIIWTAIPAILLVGLCTYAYVVLDDIEDGRGRTPMNVRVVGEQFTWTFYYRDEAARRSPRRSSPPGRHAGQVHASSPRTCCTTSGSRPSA